MRISGLIEGEFGCIAGLPVHHLLMMQFSDNPPPTRANRRYTWPWFVLGGIVLAVLLAVLWVSHEVERTRRLRQWNQPASLETTNGRP